MSSPAPRTYRQSLGFLQLVWLGVGGTIGSGIFVVPGVAAQLAGDSSLIAWLVVAVTACAVAYALGSLQSRASDGDAPRDRSFLGLFSRALGDRAAALLVLSYVGGSIFGVATIAAGLGQYLSFFGVGHLTAIEALIIAAMLALNLRGIAPSRNTESVLSVAKIAGILAIIALLVPLAHMHPVVPLSVAPLPVLLQVIIVVFWPFTGFEISAIPAAETRNPRAVAPALLTVMVLVCLIYLGLNLALLGAVGAPALAASSAPVVDAVGMVLPGSAPWVAVLAIVTMLSALNAYIIGASRTLQEVLVRHASERLTRLSTRGVPAAALLLTCAGSAVMLGFSNHFNDLAALSVVMTLVPYAALCWAAFAGGRNRTDKAVALFGGVATTAILVLYFAL
jgi:amino acid efflux transporter